MPHHIKASRPRLVLMWLLALASVVILLDQWGKRSARAHSDDDRNPLRLIRFVPHYINASRPTLVLMWLLALASVVILRSSGILFHSAASLAGLGLALGGAASNLFDVLRRGYVVNYIDLGWWPVFNLADAAIIAGLATAFLV
jgi:signal peptidase II